MAEFARFLILVVAESHGIAASEWRQVAENFVDRRDYKLLDNAIDNCNAHAIMEDHQMTRYFPKYQELQGVCA